LKLKFAIYFSVLFLLSVYANAQLGAPIVNITFGDSLPDPGPPLPVKNTNFNYSTDSCPPPGMYTITNSLYRCVAYRMGRSVDNTLNSKNGYMMLVNDTASRHSKILYVDTIKAALCPGTNYQFSAYFLNVEIPGYCNSIDVRFPQFTFNIETTAGQILASGNTGPFPYDYVPPPPPTPFTPKFHFFGINFTMPVGLNNLVLKIKDDSAGYTPCGYAYALDDVQFAAAGPTAKIAFTDDVYDGYELVKAACFQENKSLSFKGIIEPPGFINPAVQWQQRI